LKSKRGPARQGGASWKQHFAPGDDASSTVFFIERPQSLYECFILACYDVGITIYSSCTGEKMKFLKIVGLTTLIVIALAIVGVNLAFAQQPTPNDNSWINSMRNMMGGNWQGMAAMHTQTTQNGGMQAMHDWMHQGGGIHETVWNELAKQLGLTANELTAQVNSGKTIGQIATEKGVSTQDLATTMKNAMKAGLSQAVKDGRLTQEQADLMLQQMDGQYEWILTHMGTGMTGSGSGMMGNPSNRFWNGSQPSSE
jgi:uncharacterized protein YidB (DUF937 family)